MFTTAPAPLHSIVPVFSLAVFSSSPAPPEQLQLFKLQLLHPSDPCKGNVYTAIFQRDGGMWSSSLSSFLAGLATSICIGKSKGNTEVCTEPVWSEEKHEGTQPTISARCFSLFPPSLCLRRERAAPLGAASGPLGALAGCLRPPGEPGPSVRQLKAEMGATGSHTKAELQQTISEQGCARIPP